MMKKMKLFSLLLSILFLAACSNGEDSRSSSQEALDMGAPETVTQDGGAAPDEQQGLDLIGDKVIRTVYSTYETLEYENTIQHIQELIQKHNAYIEYSYESTYSPTGSFTPEGNTRQYRRMEYTLRVPTPSLNRFMTDMEGAEAVKVSEQVGSEDITQSYRDTETRIQVLRQKEERLNELLAQAENLEQILQIENSLSETIAEREMLQSQLDNYDDLIDYTSIHMTITERMRVSSTRGDAIPFWDRVKDALVDSLYAFYYWLQDAVIWLIYLLPFLVVFALLWVAFMALRKAYLGSGLAKKRAAEKDAANKRIRERSKRIPRGETAAKKSVTPPTETRTEITPDSEKEDTKPE